jgi:multiple sugar transport system permease protein
MKKNRIFKIAAGIFIAAFLGISIFPFVWMLITSFKPEAEIIGKNTYKIIADNPGISAYLKVIVDNGMLRAVLNSLIISLITVVYVIVVASMSAYVIARFRFRGKNLLMAFILAVSMFPQMVVVGPIFNLFYKLNMLNSYWISLAFTSITLPTAVWLMVTHFKQVPVALEEAAKIDGCTKWQILWKIIFPIASPGVFTTAIMTFITSWNEYLLSVTMNMDEKYQTVPVKIGFLRSQFTVFWSEVSAAAVIVVIPTLCIVLLFQKQIVSGMVSGAVKE